MSHRVFNVKEVATYLHLSIEDVEKLVRDRDIPYERIGNRTTFNRPDIDGWASRRILQLPDDRLSSYHTHSSMKVLDFSGKHALMPDLITTDRINPSLPCRTTSSVLREMVALAAKTDLVSDEDDLMRSIKEREELCSTAIPGGLALLHPRQHEPYMFPESFMVLGRTTQGIHFGALDGRTTQMFFLLCCQDDRMHLHTLARLCTMCLQTSLLNDLFLATTPQTMLAAIVASEKLVISQL